MISQNNGLKRLNTLNGLTLANQRKAAALKKTSTVPEQMMEDFLNRQQIYEKINRPYKKIDQLLDAPPKYHKFQDVLQEAKQQLAEQSLRQSQILRKKENIEKMAEVMRKEKQERRLKIQTQKKEQNQLEIWILIVIMIPIVFILTVLLEYL